MVEYVISLFFIDFLQLNMCQFKKKSKLPSIEMIQIKSCNWIYKKNIQDAYSCHNNAGPQFTKL